MSQENVDRAREVLRTLGQRDAARLVALADRDVEWHSVFALGERGAAYRGHGGTRQYMRDLGDAFELGESIVDQALGVGDVVVLVGRFHYRGKGSGAENTTEAGWMLRFRRGQVLCFRSFRNPEQALAALGASE
jgi:ketosteroid isomerase-like protein